MPGGDILGVEASIVVNERVCSLHKRIHEAGHDLHEIGLPVHRPEVSTVDQLPHLILTSSARARVILMPIESILRAKTGAPGNRRHTLLEGIVSAVTSPGPAFMGTPRALRLR